MHKTLKYILLFVIITLIQVCFIDRLEVNTYVQPLIYACFIVMLPLELGRIQTLLLGTLTGLVVDVLTGTPGLNTIATTAIAYVRPAILYYIVGHDEVKDGGAPSYRRFANNKFVFYSLYIFLIHSMVYFGVESLSLNMIGYTAIRIGVSTTICMFTIFLVDRMFNSRGTN